MDPDIDVRLAGGLKKKKKKLALRCRVICQVKRLIYVYFKCLFSSLAEADL